MGFNIDVTDLLHEAEVLQHQTNLSLAERNHANGHVFAIRQALDKLFTKHNATLRQLESLMITTQSSINAQQHVVNTNKASLQHATDQKNQIKKDINSEQRAHIDSPDTHKDINKLESTLDEAKRAAQKALDKYKASVGVLENLQNLTPRIQNEIDETNRQISQGLYTYHGVLLFENTATPNFALMVRSGVLSMKLSEYASTVSITDAQNSSRVETLFRNQLPGTDYFDSKEGKELVAYFKSGDPSLIEGQKRQSALENELWKERHASGKLSTEVQHEEALLEAEQRRQFVKQARIQIAQYEAQSKYYNDLANAGFLKSTWNFITNEGNLRNSLDYGQLGKDSFGLVFGGRDPKDGYEEVGRDLIWGGIALLVALTGAAPAEGAAGGAGATGGATAEAIGTGATAEAIGTGATGATAGAAGAAGEAAAGATGAAGEAAAGAAGEAAAGEAAATATETLSYGAPGWSEAQAEYATALYRWRNATAVLKSARQAGNPETIAQAEKALRTAREALFAIRKILGM